jgi:hypothetical protein
MAVYSLNEGGWRATPASQMPGVDTAFQKLIAHSRVELLFVRPGTNQSQQVRGDSEGKQRTTNPDEDEEGNGTTAEERERFHQKAENDDDARNLQAAFRSVDTGHQFPPFENFCSPSGATSWTT